MEDTKFADWKQYNGGYGSTNYVKEYDWGYLSYNPDTSMLPGDWAGDDDGEETAIVPRKGNMFVLNGDHRERLVEEAEKGWDAVVEYYRKQNNVSSWTLKS